MDCGKWPELNIFKSSLSFISPPGEKLVSDSGYQFLQCVTPDRVYEGEKTVHARLRARHNTCNARLKFSDILNYTSSHNVCGHGMVFHAVAKLIVWKISRERPSFTIKKD